MSSELSTAGVEQKLAECQTRIETMMNNIKQIIAELNGDAAAADISPVKGGTAGTGSLYNNSNLIKLNVGGTIYNVVNTPISVSSLYQHINKYRLTQTGHLSDPRYNSGCLGVAAGYGYRLLKGTKLTTNIENYLTYRHYDNHYTTSKDDALNVIYNELSNGRPCVLQVQGSSGRHYVTVVGMKGTVSSAKDLKEDDLLIIDAWNGKIQPLDKEKSTYNKGDRFMFAKREYIDPKTGKKTKYLSKEKFYRVCVFNMG